MKAEKLAKIIDRRIRRGGMIIHHRDSGFSYALSEVVNAYVDGAAVVIVVCRSGER